MIGALILSVAAALMWWKTMLTLKQWVTVALRTYAERTVAMMLIADRDPKELNGRVTDRKPAP